MQNDWQKSTSCDLLVFYVLEGVTINRRYQQNFVIVEKIKNLIFRCAKKLAKFQTWYSLNKSFWNVILWQVQNTTSTLIANWYAYFFYVGLHRDISVLYIQEFW